MIKLLKGVILIMENIQNKMSIFYAINLLDTHTHTHTHNKTKAATTKSA